jgi:hypothetical protein
MRRINWRMISGGVFLIVFAVGFFFIMSSNASASTDPQELLRLTGQISGVAIGVSVVLIIIGLIGKKA